jgi:glyoxylase-like metal-dependent hydrolase (beta-lactamase superfamily II)
MIDVEQQGPVKIIRMARAILGRPLYWTAAYWLDGLLIDTGPLCTARELVRALGETPVRQIVITHAHEDHIGGLGLLRECYPDAPVYAPRQSLPLIAEPSLLAMQRYRQFVWGRPQPVAGVRSLDEVNDRVKTPEFTLRAIETPGHSRDHVSYFEPQYQLTPRAPISRQRPCPPHAVARFAGQDRRSDPTGQCCAQVGRRRL